MFSQTVRSLTRCSAASEAAIIIPTTRCTTVLRRTFATPPPQVNESHLSMEEYHALADKTMEELLETLEELVDSEGHPDYEVDYHSGVLTLKLGSHGTYVINKQPPNKQIWLSSPLSGPKRYDHNDETGEWFYARDGHTFDGLLTEELSNIFGQPIKIQV
ncbi:Frataxin [Pholiota molesta]|nr:Frataxin [Pholiota molesta]